MLTRKPAKQHKRASATESATWENGIRRILNSQTARYRQPPGISGTGIMWKLPGSAGSSGGVGGERPVLVVDPESPHWNGDCLLSRLKIRAPPIEIRDPPA